MKLKITTNADKVAQRNRRREQNIKNGISSNMRDFKENMLMRARFYSGEITGPYSRGSVSGKLRSSIQSTQLRRNGKSYSFTIFQKPSLAPYGKLQEVGASSKSFIGWRPVPGRGMIRVRKPPYHKGFTGKRYMARTAVDARREIKNYIRKGVNISLRSV